MFSLLFFLFLLFLLMGIPVAFAIGASSLFAMYADGISLMVVPQQMFQGVNSFALVAVPMFILAGDLMAQGKVSERLVTFAESMFGFVKGGLSLVAIGSGMFFAAISGSGAATTAAVSSSLVPELEKKGYDPASVSSLIAASGTIGVVIPPSVPMIIYAVISQQSVSKLFLSGVAPGVLMGLGLAVISVLQAYKKNYPRGDDFSLLKVLKSFLASLWGLLTPVIILGGIFSGIFTPSEAAVVAVIYAAFVAVFVYQDLSVKDVFNILSRSAVTTAVIMFVISTSAVLSWTLSNWDVPKIIAESVLSISSDPMAVMLLVISVILVTGIFVETASALIILTPVLLPLVVKIGVDPIHFGVVIVMGLAVGMVTPPVAINLYVASSVTRIPLERIAKSVVPYLLVLVCVLFLVGYVPLFF